MKLQNPNGRWYEIDIRTNHLYVKTDHYPIYNGMFIDCSWEKFYESWKSWINGELIQHAFSYLDTDAREFLITGMLPSEWNELFNENEVGDDL